jgi:copper chaperone CopZ
MRNFKFLLQLILIGFLTIAASCGSKNKTEKVSAETASVIEVSIGGMTCTGCEQTIQNNLGKLEGIKSVKASFTTGNAVVEYFPGKVDTLKMKETVTGSGYTVKKFITVQN